MTQIALVRYSEGSQFAIFMSTENMVNHLLESLSKHIQKEKFRTPLIKPHKITKT